MAIREVPDSNNIYHLHLQNVCSQAHIFLLQSKVEVQFVILLVDVVLKSIATVLQIFLIGLQVSFSALCVAADPFCISLLSPLGTVELVLDQQFLQRLWPVIHPNVRQPNVLADIRLLLGPDLVQQIMDATACHW